ncbi:hypothetical protein GCM10023346_03390 [Arthrobacter gyeryongensis]|uniref:Uncharacterized protein n=1 Tax=Arthrobacter gyeryongensis TaxID=1650592 RepID=A0ABP9S0B5_9MICC
MLSLPVGAEAQATELLSCTATAVRAVLPTRMASRLTGGVRAGHLALTSELSGLRARREPAVAVPEVRPAAAVEAVAAEVG